jgi:hypothetical protein
LEKAEEVKVDREKEAATVASRPAVVTWGRAPSFAEILKKEATATSGTAG